MASARRSTRPRKRRAAGKSTHTLGQVVHNEGVISDLQALGIQTVETLDDVDHGAAVVIRAHGVRPEVMERADERGLEVIDGTCTWVIQEQREIVKLVEEGYTIVLLGTPRHPEVVGLLGFAPDAIVVDEEEDWDRRSRGARRWRSSARAPSRPGSSRSSPRSWSVGATSSRSSTPSARSRSAARRTRSRRPGRRPHGRRRRPVLREHEGAHPPVRDRRHPSDPDRGRARPDRRGAFDGHADRRRDRRHLDPDRGPARGRPSGSSSSPGTPDAGPAPPSSPHAAFALAATPAGRTTSLPTSSSRPPAPTPATGAA